VAKEKTMTIENYCKVLKGEFDAHSEEMQKTNHEQHNKEPNYWDYLLGKVKTNPELWTGKAALDFGCGCGRNLKNMADLAKFDRVDGVDICSENAKFAGKYIAETHPNVKSRTWENNGFDVQPCDDNVYDFIMSHQVLQHISNYDVRFSLLTDLYRVLKPEGLLSIHFMDLDMHLPYYGKNDGSSCLNVVIGDPKHVVDDLEKIGYQDVSFTHTEDMYGKRNEYYFEGTKK
jgi:2-polyprenyl-3-methyl-5-hydroxy-6-metoxy-1,4-benzoquinol methylase